MLPNKIYPVADVMKNAIIRNAVEEAIEEWERTTCIQFFREKEADLLLSGYDKVDRYVRFVKGAG